MLNKFIFIVTTILVFSSVYPAIADDTDILIEARKCSALEGADLRMTCYDAVFRGAGKAIIPTEEQGAISDSSTEQSAEQVIDLRNETSPGQQWHFRAKESALDGRKDVWLSISSENTQPNQIGSAEHATLWVRCMDNTTAALIGFNSYVSSGQNVRFRVDKEAVRKIRMEPMAGGDGIGIWSGSRSIPFIKYLFDKSKLVISFDTYSSQGVEFSFDVSGLRERIDPLAAACRWTQ